MKLKSVDFYLVLLLTIGLFFVVPLLKPGFYESHDGEVHVARFAAYYKAFTDGQIPPRWAEDVNYGYGSPLFIFFYPLPYYLGSLLHFLGFGLEDAFKILIGVSFLFAPLSFYAFASKLFRQELAFIGALLYGLLPYHFLDLYVRGDIGEIMSFVFVPLVLFFLEKVIEKPRISLILWGGISYALLMLSHNGITFIFTPLLLIYSIVRARKKKDFVQSLSMFILGLLLSAYFWIPVLYEGRYIQKSLFVNFFKEHFITISQLIYSPWGFGPDVNKEGGLSPQIGMLLFVLVLIAILRNHKKQMVKFWFLIFLAGLFFSTNISSVLWERISLLRDLQFPWRFTAIIGFASVLLACYSLEGVRSKKLLTLIVFLAVVVSLPLAKINQSMKKGDRYYFSFQGVPYHHGEATTIWTAGDPGQKAAQQVEVIASESSVSEIAKKSNEHKFTVSAKTSNTRILDNTIYFPGWQVDIDGQKVPIEFQDINYRGLITFSVPQGQHKIEVKFRESPIRLFSDIISVTTIIFITGIWVFRKRLNYF